MKRKIIAVALIAAMLAAAVISGTLAYFTDTDEAVNVMTMGNVDIRLIEKERDASGALVPFTGDKPVYPAVGPIEWAEKGVDVNGDGIEYKVFTDDLKNVIDKFVTVQNVGSGDAYVRTVVAIEAPEGDPDDLIHVGMNSEGIIFSGWSVTKINNVDYVIGTFTYEDVLGAGQVSAPSLMQVFLDSEATNEDAEALGDTWTIRVLAQAVQAAGFDTADAALKAGFGEITADNHPWSTRTAAQPNDIDSALNSGVGFVDLVLSEDIKVEDGVVIPSDVEAVIDLNENTMEASYVQSNGETQIRSGTINAGSPQDYAAIASNADASLTLTNVNINSAGGGIGAAGGAQVVVDGGSIAVNSTSTSGRYNVYAEGEGTVVIINDGEFAFSKTLNQKRAYIYAGAGTTVYVNGGTFGPASTRSGYTAGILGNGTVVIKGGTFGFDPSNWTADGYEAVKNGTTWTVSAK